MQTAHTYHNLLPFFKNEFFKIITDRKTSLQTLNHKNITNNDTELRFALPYNGDHPQEREEITSTFAYFRMMDLC